MNTTIIHQDAIIIDGLNVSNWSRSVFENIHTGGVTAINATTAVIDDFRETISNLAAWETFFQENADLIMRVEKADDILQAKRGGKRVSFSAFKILRRLKMTCRSC
ncbi:MAG TPA: hypothetical protein VFD70_28200 [Anaerolineae bacterium]|nr:hypothetical protein [Anaerolineae bacterium]